MEKKRKRITSGAAVVLAAVLAVTGTLAWQSISQRARDGEELPFNPGGRLHDDFDGESRDIYVENFGEEPIFARVRLDEYMETGTDAGLKNPKTGEKQATPVEGMPAGSSIDDADTWRTRKPSTDDGITKAWIWDLSGGSTVYLPTFNKDNRSLAADINGTWDGKDKKDDRHYDDYQSYTLNEEIGGYENRGQAEGEVWATHTAQETLSGTVIKMEKWKENPWPGNYWVWDEDGWFYWANPIAPGGTTGLLLNGITQAEDTTERWYYGLNAVGQFVSVGDAGESDGSGFFDLSQSAAKPTEDARKLLKIIGAFAVSNDVEAIRAQIRATSPCTADTVSDTVTIDGVEWYVLAKDEENQRALLLSKNLLENRAFDSGGTTNWASSEICSYLNGAWLEVHPTVKASAQKTTIYTSYGEDGSDYTTYISENKVFLLSEEDVFGTTRGFMGAAPELFTYNGEKLSAMSNREIRVAMDIYGHSVNNGYNRVYMLRSSGRYYSTYAYVGQSLGSDPYKVKTCIRPAFWFDMTR